MRLSELPRALVSVLKPAVLLTATGLVAALGGAGLVQPARAGALFAAVDVPQERFVLVSAPIGDGTRGQLNIYEQLNGKRRIGKKGVPKLPHAFHCGMTK